MSTEQRAEYWKAEHLAGNRVIDEQAERIRVLREALTGLLDLFHEGQVTARDEASGYVQAAVSAGERTLEATK